MNVKDLQSISPISNSNEHQWNWPGRPCRGPKYKERVLDVVPGAFAQRAQHHWQNEKGYA